MPMSRTRNEPLKLKSEIEIAAAIEDVRGNVAFSGTIKYLFNESALTGKEHRLIYNLDQGTYRGKVVEATGEIVDITGIGSASKLAGDVRFRDLQLPGRGTFTAGEVSVRFHPSGWVEESGIHLEDGQNNKLTLHVMPLTGTCEFREGYKTL